MFIISLILIVPGIVCLYALVIRGLLQKVPALKEFYSQADGFWAKVWALTGNSFTMAWGNIVGGIGTLLTLLDPVASALGDPDLKGQVTTTLQSNPKILGYVMVGISIVTIVARLRSISKAV